MPRDEALTNRLTPKGSLTFPSLRTTSYVLTTSSREACYIGARHIGNV
jgi:hypothetical protein